MKKLVALSSTLLLTLSLGACAAAPANSELAPATEEKTEMANPWTSAKTPTEAADGAGVGYFNLPADGTVLEEGGQINWSGFQYMKLLAETDGYVGSADLVVRKGVNRPAEEVAYDTADVSGDYNEYAYSWDMEAAGWQVKCYGNEEGRIMKAVWHSDNFSFSINVRGQGDIANTYGLSEADMATLIASVE